MAATAPIANPVRSGRVVNRFSLARVALLTTVGLVVAASGCGSHTSEQGGLHPFLTESEWSVQFDTGIVGHPAGFSPDGKWFVATGAGDEVAVLNVRDGSVVKKWNTGQTADEFSGLIAQISPDGRYLATGGESPGLIVWDFKTFEEISSASLAREPDPRLNLGTDFSITSINWAPSSDAIVTTANGPNEAHVWNPKDGSLVRTLTGHSEFAIAASYVLGGDFIATASDDRTVRLWDTKDFSQAAALSAHPDRIWKMGVSNDGKKLATGGAFTWEDREGIVIWDIEQRKPLHKFRTDYEIEQMLFSPDDQHIMWADRYECQVWNLRDGKRQLYGKVMNFKFDPGIKFSADKNHVGVRDRQHRVFVLQRQTPVVEK